MLFGTTFGGSTIKAGEDEAVEPDELGTRVVEHGERVCNQPSVVYLDLNPGSHFILQMKSGILGHLDSRQVQI